MPEPIDKVDKAFKTRNACDRCAGESPQAQVIQCAQCGADVTASNIDCKKTGRFLGAH
jgi:ribosomal protein L37E